MYLAFRVYRNHTTRTRLKLYLCGNVAFYCFLSTYLRRLIKLLSTLSTPLMLSSPEFAFYNYRRALKRRETKRLGDQVLPLLLLKLKSVDAVSRISSPRLITFLFNERQKALLQAQAQNLLQHQYNQISQGGHGSINPYSTNMTPTPPKRSSINSLVETTTGKRPRLDQPTIEGDYFGLFLVKTIMGHIVINNHLKIPFCTFRNESL